MNAQVGHADIVGIWIDEGDGDFASPVFDDSAFFPGKPPGFFSFIPTHEFVTTLCLLPAAPAHLIIAPISIVIKNE